MTKLPQPLRGIVPPLLTPFRSNREVDVAALETLINRMIDGGVHGIFALGTTGEGPQLPHRLRHQIVEYVCEAVAGRVPVLVCISDTCFEEAVELADQAHSAGAAGVVKTAPYYLPMDQAELAEYTLRLTDRSGRAAAAGARPLPDCRYRSVRSAPGGAPTAPRARRDSRPTPLRRAVNRRDDLRAG